MYKPAVAGGAVTTVLGLKITKGGGLPFTGFATVAYVLLGIALLVTGLLLARLGRARDDATAGALQRERIVRAAVATVVAAAGLLVVVFSSWWRGIEAWTTAHSIGLVTSHATAAFGGGIVVMHHGASSLSAFALTRECSVAQIMGAILIGGAPLFLVRRLSIRRVGVALLLASAVLVVANIVRLTAIGVAIQAWGSDGFSLAHTYLGSLVTFVGTCLAGVTFAAVLLARQRREIPSPAQG